MSDPLSVAASAVGIISIRLQDCGQIVFYSQACKACGEDIKSFGSKAGINRALLKRLRDLFEDTEYTDPEITDDLNERISDIGEIAERIHAKLEKCKSVANGLCDKIHM